MIQIFLNGKIYTADENQLEATAFVVEDGKFIHVGSDEEAIKFKENNAKIYDFKGSRILPGFMDTHCHYIAMASKSADDNIEIDQKMSHNDLLNFLAQLVKNKTIEELPFIIGLGYGTQCIPLASELDKVINDRPVFLWDSGGHSGWMNTKLMDIIGINKDTPDPKPGISYFTRDDDGNPTGQAVENDAMLYVEKRMGAASPEVLKKQFPDLCKLINSYGYTSAFDAGFLLMDEEIVLETLNSMDFSLRLFTSFYYDGFQKTSTFLKEMKKCRDLYISDKIYPLTLKMFKDGTVEAFSAWMFEDYCKPGFGRGAESLTHNQLFEMANLACQSDFNVHIHAIGDAAISDTLDVYDELGDIKGTKTIAHVQVLPKDGILRFSKQKDVFYQTTPVWLGFDQFTKDVLCGDRYLRQMPLNSLKNNGNFLTFGSDAPVSSGFAGVNPFNNICFAVNRNKDLINIIPPANEAISVEDCIDAYTINGARQVGLEDEIGSITVGKKADFIVIDRDILNMDSKLIYKTKVKQTWFEGICVFKRN